MGSGEVLYNVLCIATDIGHKHFWNWSLVINLEGIEKLLYSKFTLLVCIMVNHYLYTIYNMYIIPEVKLHSIKRD